MKLMIITLILAMFTHSTPSLAKTSSPVDSTNAKVYREIKSTLGLVPTFFKNYPAEALEGAWEDFKAIQLSENTILTPKEKDLIGLAVSAQIPCRYCNYFHKKGAQMNGVTSSEINLALAVGGVARKWSTYLAGSQIDLPMFKSEIDQMIKYVNAQQELGKKDSYLLKPEVAVTDANSAYRDMETQFGFVPNFMRQYPSAALPGAWKTFKAVNMNPNAVLSSKTKDLISLAVSSQIPCQYCVYADTEFARHDGATQTEIQETIALSGHIRHWSTMINGLQPNEREFEKEVDQIFKYLKARSTKHMAVVSK